MGLLYKIWLSLALSGVSITACAQSPAFYHLSTAEGLSDNSVNAVRPDQNGILWIATSEGLNSFDGHTITTYFKEQYPALADNNVLQVICDDANRVWLRTSAAGITMLDEKRNFHFFPVGDSNDKGSVNHIIQTKSQGLVVLKGNKQFTWKENSEHRFTPLYWPGDTIIPRTIRFFNSFDDDKIIFCGTNRLVLVDYGAMKPILDMPFANINGVARINENELLIYTINNNSFYRVNITTKKIIEEYVNLLDQDGQPVSKDLRNICRIDNNRFIISSRFSGLYSFDILTKKIERWYHDPVDQRSVGGDNTFTVLYDKSGYLFVTTRTSGIHYFNVLQPQADYRSYFRDRENNFFDGFIQAIVSGKDHTVWLGTQDRLIHWNSVTGQTSFINYYLPSGENLHKEETIRALLMDKKENLWVGTSRHGILILDKQLKTIKQLDNSIDGSAISLQSNWINAFCRDKTGNIWVATLRGIVKINETTFAVQTLTDHPLLAKISRLYCNTVWLDQTGRLWIGTDNGAWCYDEKNNSLQSWNVNTGLSHNRVLSFNEDNDGNIYIGTVGGLSLLQKDRTIVVINRSNGLRNDKCEGILKDEKGFLWIGNLNCILRFDPATRKYAVFEEGFGISHSGFRMRSCYKSETGEMFWGSDKGLAWFYPQQMSRVTTRLNPTIHSLHTPDSIYRFTHKDVVSFPYNLSSFFLRFSSGELTAGKKIKFLYRLAGYEDEWKVPETVGQVGYNRLPPGKYSFELKASLDGSTWFDAAYPVAVTIAKPWWRETWFRLVCAFIAIFLLYVVYRYYQQRKKSLEMNRMIDYFANSGYEHSSVQDILWDICRNCIARLDFEDCVIYLVDEERKVLLQKAAYGPKNPTAFEIVNPIEIPIGKGIVGDVAKTGKGGITNDTSKDKRYIVDDEQRLSELTVPLVHEGQVIGVIDSEHRKRNFFTHRHLQALQTIASLCSAKISRAMALEAMKKSRMEVMELNMKMAESKFLNLRLQMNPHFLFNSLSSIQHLIVSQQTTKAYKYLTVFSNFLRSLLKYAEKNFIPLDEELEVLKMYIELESLRFDQSFRYEISIDESLANDEVLIPSLMVQPFAENAIWHGLLHKEGDKRLSIRFANNSEEYLSCCIEDNGVGREKAMLIRQENISSRVHESKGIGIIKERLGLLQQKTGKPANVEIQDLWDELLQPCGTKVIITIPYYNSEES